MREDLKTELLREQSKERDSALKKGRWQWHLQDSRFERYLGIIINNNSLID